MHALKSQHEQEKRLQRAKLFMWAPDHCFGTPLTGAQQHFAFAQVLDGFGHFGQTLLREVWRVSKNDVEAPRSHVGGKGQRLAVVVEDIVIAVCGEAAVVLKHDDRHAVRTIDRALLQLLVHTGRAHTSYPKIRTETTKFIKTRYGQIQQIFTY